MLINFFIINFKTEKVLFKFLKSVSIALNNSKKVKLKIYILDNSIKNKKIFSEFVSYINENFKLNIYCYNMKNNFGYFGCMNFAKKLVDKNVDYIFYSNPDLLMHKSFFINLKLVKTDAKILAPSIVNMNNRLDFNPLYSTRITKNKLLLIKFFTSHTYLYLLYSFLNNIKNLMIKFFSSIAPFKNKTIIYAPYGAFIIFKKDFFMRLISFNSFLFCEEIFLAEEAIIAKVSIEYVRNLRLYHYRSRAVKKIKTFEKVNYINNSIKFILDKYF
jgi:hypothetical protein